MSAAGRCLPDHRELHRSSIRSWPRRRSRAGATQCEADASLQRGLTVTVRLGEVDTIEYQRDRGLG